jgi:RimJ/RimL family protein N-acetyltransferase
LHYQPPAWGDRFSAVLGVDLPLLFRASYYAFRGLAVDWRRRVPAGFRMRRVDRALLEDAGVVNREVVAHKIETNWNSVEDFVERGPGFCLVHGDTIVSECLADCVVGDRCEIGIWTDERYRRRGLATLTVAATVEGCLARGLTSIGWHCANNNVASRRTAERVGFEKVAEYPIYWVCFDRQRNLLANGMYSLLEAQQAGRAAALFGEAFGLGEVEARYYYYASAAEALLGEREAASRYREMALARGLGDGERLEAEERIKGVRRTRAVARGEHSPPAPRYIE